MGSRPARHRYCRCGTPLATDNSGRQCARCQRASQDKLITPPQVPAEFWQHERFRQAFAAQHMGRISRAYRMHPHHYAVYGPCGISQSLLGQWLGLRQPQISRIETGPPIRHLDTLQHAGDYGLAQRYHVAALRAAHTADDRPLGAHILAFMANQAARLEQPAEAATLIETALAGTRGRATPALLAELHIRQATAFSALGDTSACTAAITQARTQVELLKSDDDPPWLYWLNPASITVTAGYCLLRLGHNEQAAATLTEGIGQFGELFVRDRQVYTTYLANALARPGKQRDLDAAAELGLQSINLAESLDSTRGTGLLRDLYFRMKPHGEVPAVRDFLERAHGLVA